MNVNRQEFLIDIPELYPNTSEHIAFWRQERQRCIEGYWVSGYWMPGKLYFYVNYSTIKLNKQPKVKSLGKPWLRDIEWNFFRLLEEAKGFSGFMGDPDYSCHEALKANLADEEIILDYCTDEHGNIIEDRYSNIYKSDGFTRKEYVNPREYIQSQHAFDKGCPAYNNQSQNLMMIGARGFGKDLHKDTSLWYEDREAPISEVRIGDKIYGPSGELIEVTNVYTFNDQLQYEITLSDGRTIKCGAGHKWQLEERQRDGSYKTVVKELKDILHDYRYGKRGDSKYFIKYTDPIQYSRKELPIDPYTLGALLGDGGLTQSISFTTSDPQILEEFVLPENCRINKLAGKYQYSITKVKGKLNPLTEALKILKLFRKKSTEKFIPEIYMRSSVEQRMALLQGLMDTDGSITKEGQIEFSQSNEILGNQVKKLCETLGIRCKLSKKKTSRRDSYRLHIISSKPLFKLKRKLDRLNLRPSKYASTNRQMCAIKSIKSLKVEDSYCISVDSPDNLFLGGPCIPTHNSYMISAVMAHEFLFDGLTKYQSQKDTETSSEVVAGAGDAKYSSDTLDKVKLCLENLPGDIDLRGRHFPSPFTKRYTGSWIPGKQVVASYKKKIGGSWRHVGTKSSIKHRTFKDNPFAANGTRPGIMTFEEVGMFDNLKESYAASVECQRDGAIKFGTMIFIGTGGDMKGGGCLTGETRVWDSKGNLHQLKDLPVDSGIKGFNQETQKVSDEPISYWQKYTEKPCYKITTNSGRYIQASEEHPILYSKASNFRQSHRINGKRIYEKKVDWKQAKDIEIGDQLAIADIIPITSEINYDHCRLLGLLIGDGTYGPRKSPVLSNNDPDILNFVEKNYNTSTKLERTCKDGSTYKEIVVKEFIPILREHGICGQVKLEKTLPKNVHSFSKQSITELLGGFFDTDGTVSESCIQLASISFSLMDEVRFLLQRLGIHCTIHKRTSKPTKLVNKFSEWYVLQIKDKRSVLRFYQDITFLSSKKQEKLKKLKDVIERKKDHFSENLSGLRFEQVKSIEYIGVHPVYNLTADATNTYLGNGIVTHNTRSAHEIFYNPAAYDCLQLEDTWEHRGKIGFFVPAYLGLNQFKDSNGFTNESRSKKFLEDHRRKLLTSGSTTALDGELINRPIKPSEIFLLKHGNVFPIHELQDRLATIDRPEIISHLQLPVYLFYDAKAKGGINYKIDTKRELRPINDFPFNGDNREGSIVIYQLPELDEDGNVPKGLYIIGHDPYSSDDPTGGSLASIYVLKTKKHLKYGHDQIVASFVGRPYHGRNIVNEHLMKLSMFYGDATIYFENATGNTKEFFEKYRKLHLLAKQPQTILAKKAAFDSKAPNIYGYPMSSRTIKLQAIQYLRDWLLEERGADDTGRIIRNLDLIPDKALLQELIAFNMDGNFDRVMGLAGCIIGLEETHNQYIQTYEKVTQIESAIQFFSTNTKLFKSQNNARQFQLSKTAAFL